MRRTAKGGGGGGDRGRGCDGRATWPVEIRINQILLLLLF